MYVTSLFGCEVNSMNRFLNSKRKKKSDHQFIEVYGEYVMNEEGDLSCVVCLIVRDEQRSGCPPVIAEDLKRV